MTYEFDVALSFAGEDRKYVEQVANALRKNNIRVFYDEFEVATLWGEDLYVRLDDIYREKSRYAMVFASENYTRKMWTSHERQSAQARALQEKGPYLLPVRLDDSAVPGLRPTVGYLDGGTRPPEEIANLFMSKLRAEGGTRVVSTLDEIIGVPLTGAEKQRLLSVRPPGWEYLLMAGGLWHGVFGPEQKNLDHDLRFAATRANHVAGADFMNFISMSTDRLFSIISKMDVVISEESQIKALGKPGEPGDAVRIDHMCKRFGTAYEELLDWSADIRGTSCPSEYLEVLELLARWTDSPINQTRKFVADVVAEVSKIPAHIASGTKETLAIVMRLNFTMDDDLTRDFHAAVRRALTAQK